MPILTHARELNAMMAGLQFDRAAAHFPGRCHELRVGIERLPQDLAIHRQLNGRKVVGSGSDVLIGGPTGTSILTSGNARSILIADQGTADTLDGGTAGNIIIGGYTTYDSYTAAHDQALLDVLAEWTSGDSYTTRIAKIRSGVGTGKLNAITVHDLTTGDVLQGQGNYPNDPDWYWAAATSEIHDPDGSNEQVN